MEQISSQRYPAGVQALAGIRRRGFVYVDKTNLTFQLVDSGPKYFLLRRPRRFGKSSMLFAMRVYFEGERDLFRGLAIEKLE